MPLLQVLHKVLADGSIQHVEFTTRSWDDAIKDPLVIRQHTHKPNECPSAKPTPVSTTAIPSEPSPVVLVDSLNLLFRSHYAMKNLSTRDGRPTGTYHGFFSAVHQLIIKRGWRLVFCWDGGIPRKGSRRIPNWRLRFLPSYKGTRCPTEDTTTIFQQIPEVIRVLDSLGFLSVGIPGLEADDVIGILTGENPEERIEIFSSDQDMFQLTRHGANLGRGDVTVVKPGRSGKPDWVRVSAKGLWKEHNIHARDWAKYLALGGDSSDNLKPIEGFGPVTARTLVRLGIDPIVPFDKNPEPVRQSRFAERLEQNWKAVQLAYAAALIPHSLWDKRILFHTKNWRMLPLSYYQGPIPHSREQGLLEFTRFCADYELVVLLSKRREFFRKESNES